MTDCLWELQKASLKIGNAGMLEVFTTVGGLRTTRMVLNQQMIDATHRESGAWRALLDVAGLRWVTIARQRVVHRCGIRGRLAQCGLGRKCQKVGMLFR